MRRTCWPSVAPVSSSFAAFFRLQVDAIYQKTLAPRLQKFLQAVLVDNAADLVQYGPFIPASIPIPPKSWRHVSIHPFIIVYISGPVPLTNLILTNKWRDVFAFNSTYGWECPTSLEYEQNIPRQQQRLPHLHLFFNSISASTSSSPTPAFKQKCQCGDPSGDSLLLPGILLNVITEITSWDACSYRISKKCIFVICLYLWSWRWYRSLGKAWLPFCFWRSDDWWQGTSLRIWYGKWTGINLWSWILPCQKTKYWNFVCNIFAHLGTVYSHLNFDDHNQYSSFEEYCIQFTWSYHQADSADCTTEFSGDPQGFFKHVMTRIQGKFSTTQILR